MTHPLIAVVGLRREAALLAAPEIAVVAGGGDNDRLLSKLSDAVAGRQPRAVVSVGLCGALSSALTVGDWVIGERIVGVARGWACDAGLIAELRAGLATVARSMELQSHGRGPRRKADTFQRVHLGAIAGSDVMVVDALAKAALHAASGALAVDMESHVAARFAAEHGLPFAALRVISDGADRALPKAAQAGMKADGGMDILAVLRKLAKDPHQLPALIRTGREAEVAFRQLKLLGRHDLLGRLGVGDADLGQFALHMV